MKITPPLGVGLCETCTTPCACGAGEHPAGTRLQVSLVSLVACSIQVRTLTQTTASTEQTAQREKELRDKLASLTAEQTLLTQRQTDFNRSLAAELTDAKKLKKRNQKESEWQEFLKKNMLFINSAYIKLIEKKNIHISVSIPDFLLIDQFQFMDVFEIKKPDFECLKFEKTEN
jgi:hypothetical protein